MENYSQEGDLEYEFDIPKDLPLSEWRQKYDQLYGSEVVDSMIASVVKNMQGSSEGALKEADGQDYISVNAQNYIRYLLVPEFEAKKQLAEIWDNYSNEEKVLISNMTVASLGGDLSIIVDKVKSAETLRGQCLEALGRNPEKLVYFGSGEDVELAVLTRAKDISLVDPILRDEKYDQAMLERIKKYAKDGTVNYDLESRTFTFTFKDQTDVVRIYPIDMMEFIKSTDDKFDAVLMFNKMPLMPTSEAKKVLVDGGVCFDNKAD